MQVQVVFGGGAANVPLINIDLGASVIYVFVDGNEFTGASNDLGSAGYTVMETPLVDIGSVDDDLQNLFTHLHGAVVHWNIKTNIFAVDGGIATITMGIPVQQDGVVIEKKIQFVASNCRGVSVLQNTLDFSCEMLQSDHLAQLDTGQILSDDAVAAAVAAAPQAGDTAAA